MSTNDKMSQVYRQINGSWNLHVDSWGLSCQFFFSWKWQKIVNIQLYEVIRCYSGHHIQRIPSKPKKPWYARSLIHSEQFNFPMNTEFTQRKTIILW